MELVLQQYSYNPSDWKIFYVRTFFFPKKGGTSLAVQQLRLHAPTARGEGSIPGQGTNILHAAW